jgi:hypothetical protein
MTSTGSKRQFAVFAILVSMESPMVWMLGISITLEIDYDQVSDGGMIEQNYATVIGTVWTSRSVPGCSRVIPA